MTVVMLKNQADMSTRDKELLEVAKRNLEENLEKSVKARTARTWGSWQD